MLLFIDSFFEFLEIKDNTLITKLIIECFLWLAVAVAITFDLLSGIRAARKRGEMRVSEGYRRTIDKAKQYYGFLVYAFLFDCLIMFVLGRFGVDRLKIIPFASLIVTAYLIFIEGRSFFENASNKHKQTVKEDITTIISILSKNEGLKKAVLEEINDKLKKL